MDSISRDLPRPAAVLPGGREAGVPWRIRLVRHLHHDLAEGHHLQCHPSALTDRVSATSDSPAALLARIAQGDSRAMESCLEIHGPLVWGIVLRRVRDRSAAEDLTQEIFTDIWKHAGRHDPAQASEAGFIAMIARRRTIDWCRRQMRLPEMAALHESPDIPAEAATGGDHHDREVLWQALGRLPEETRHLFRLHFEQGMTHSEISEKTGLPLGSVKTRLRRGLIEARAMLARLRGVHPSTEALS